MDDEKPKTKLSILDLEEVIRFLKEYRSQFATIGSYPTQAEIDAINRAVRYAENLRELYSICCICGRLIEPDMPTGYDPQQEDFTCFKCSTEGY